ncbi:peptidoglycan-binding protein [Lysobacter sp. cf310]|uniref:peptidoglycan-binding protein n=1 Tax=Lysobacter sp. cf310 TaxID=1761790 RepID=UPI0008EC2816|nr:peptidoglycan-binding protein [Lysobacter sp. cf310]SFK69661.1 Peptidoglycan-binding (PGRP) domain of peptidoglycan hydrolases-containing protein [Lysobacter sp. cf310]
MSDGYGRSAASPITRDQAVRLIVQTCLNEGVTDQRQIAYVLATAEHESLNFTKPEEDYGRQQAARLGYQGGEEYFGRGYAHLTHRDNYQRLGEALGRGSELADTPALAADPQTASRVLVIGMRDGLFTERRLDQYVNANTTDYDGARAIVNGSDRAAHIAGLARGWEGQVADLVTSVQRDGVDLTPAAPAPAADAVLRSGDANARAFEMQQYLAALNVRGTNGQAISPDGDFGPSTAQAVRNYQRDAGITPQTGTVDQALMDRMRGDVLQADPNFRLKSITDLYGPLNDRVLNTGDRGDPVADLQGQLRGLGYRDNDGLLDVTRRYDANTQAAVRRFQRDENIEPANGIADERTRDAINARAVERGLPEAAEAVRRRQENAAAPDPQAPAQQAPGAAPVAPPAQPPGDQRQGAVQPTGGAQSTYASMFPQVLDHVHGVERERGIPAGQHSANLAGVLTVASLRADINPDRVELNNDGSRARAVEVSRVNDHPAFNRSTEAVHTAAAVAVPQRQSAEEGERVVAERELAQRTATQNQTQTQGSGMRMA